MNVPTLLAARPAAADVAAAPARDLAAALCAEAPRLRRLVHRLLGWRAHAGELDDVVQEALLKAWRQRATFRGDAALATWLTRITIRAAHDHVRRARLRQRLFGWWSPAAPPAAAAPGDVAAPVDGDRDAGPEADADAPAARTRRALQRLAHADREVLVLRYLEQREIPAIADLLGVTRGAVDARLTRARIRLRAELGLEEAP